MALTAVTHAAVFCRIVPQHCVGAAIGNGRRPNRQTVHPAACTRSAAVSGHTNARTAELADGPRRLPVADHPFV